MIPFFYEIVRKYDLNIILWMFVSAMMGSGLPSFLYAYSASRMDSNINGVINSLTPIFTMIIGIVWMKYSISRLSLFGVFIGFLGVMLLITQKGISTHQTQYAMFPLLATMMYGVNMNIVKVKLSHLPSMDILKGIFSILGIIFTPIVFCLGIFHRHPLRWTNFYFWKPCLNIELQNLYSFIALFMLGCIGSLFASYIFYRLVKNTNALFSSMNTYLIPLMAIFWGWMDGESIGYMHFVSLIVILIGVYLVSKRK